MALEPEFKSKLDEACKVAEDFVRLYYKTIEHRPHKANLLYIDSSVMIWDGNPLCGAVAINNFFVDMPPLTFQLVSMDAQPVSHVAVGTQKAFLINTSGTYKPSGEPQRGFIQNFIVTEDGGKWRIASDTLRSQISPNQAPAH